MPLPRASPRAPDLAPGGKPRRCASAYPESQANFPYAGTCVGPEPFVADVFYRSGTKWEGGQAKVHTYLADGDRVAAFGVYSGERKIERLAKPL